MCVNLSRNPEIGLGGRVTLPNNLLLNQIQSFNDLFQRCFLEFFAGPDLKRVKVYNLPQKFI